MLLDDDEKKLVLEKVKELVREKTSGTNRKSIEQYNKEIEEAEREIEAGDFIHMKTC